MENWQFLFVNFVIIGFITQIILIIGVYFISKSLPKEKTDREILESLYQRHSYSVFLSKILKFKQYG